MGVVLVGWTGINWNPDLALAQDNLSTSPYLPFPSAEPRPYNLKWGRISGRFEGSLHTEFNDNINLSNLEPEADLSFGPKVGLGFVWPLKRNQVMEFNIGVGYRYFIAHPELNTFNVTPDTRWSHRITIDPVQFEVYNTFSVQMDPTSQRELSGTGGLLDFRRIRNVAGLRTEWQPTSTFGLQGGYAYGLDRTLTDQFSFLDRDDHTADAAAFFRLSRRWTAGVSASYTTVRYVEPIQNDGDYFSVGPVLRYQPSRFLQFQASGGYTFSEFDSSGNTLDSNDFTGFTYEFRANHQLNRRIFHDLRLRRLMTPGFGSNFTDTFSLQYSVDAQVFAGINLNWRFAYENYEASGVGGDTADRYLVYLGSQLRLSSNWRLRVNYAYAMKNSARANADYQQNRIAIELVREF